VFYFYTGIFSFIVAAKIVFMLKQSGFSLIEILLAWCIASVSIMMLLQYQHQSLLQVQQAYRRSQVMAKLSTVLHCLHYAPALIHSNNWLQHWQHQVAKLGFHAQLSVHCQASLCQGQVEWRDHGVLQLYRLNIETH